MDSAAPSSALGVSTFETRRAIAISQTWPGRTFVASVVSAGVLGPPLAHCSTGAAAPHVPRPHPAGAVPQRTAEDPLPPFPSRASIALLGGGASDPETPGPAPPRSLTSGPADSVAPQRPAAPAFGRSARATPTRPLDGDWAEPIASQWRGEHGGKRFAGAAPPRPSRAW